MIPDVGSTRPLLDKLGALPDGPPEGLKSFLRKPIKNTRGDCVGEVMMRADAG